MKLCTRCGDTKPFAEFYKDAQKSDGLQSHCKVCEKARAAAWRAVNQEKVKAAVAKWQADNPGKIKAVAANRYAANRDTIKAADALRYKANREKVKASCAKWRAENPEKVKALHAKWHAENPEAARIHKQNRRARKLENGGKLSKGLADKLFRLQRGKCACCRVSIADGNHLDHRIPVALGGPNEDWNMQLLCPLCNLQKGAKHPVEFMQQRGFLL